jgi:hypothetical protein
MPLFVEDVNWCVRGTHEFHEHWATTNSNVSTVIEIISLLFLAYFVLIWIWFYCSSIKIQQGSSSERCSLLAVLHNVTVSLIVTKYHHCLSAALSIIKEWKSMTITNKPHQWMDKHQFQYTDIYIYISNTDF